jgi:hypothetical protein
MSSLPLKPKGNQALLHGWSYGDWQRFLRARLLQTSRTLFRVADAVIWFAFRAGQDGTPAGRCMASTRTLAARAALTYSEKQCRCRQLERALADLVALGLIFPTDPRYWLGSPRQRGGRKRSAMQILKPGSDEQMAVALWNAAERRGDDACTRLMDFLGKTLGEPQSWGDWKTCGQPFRPEHALLSEEEIFDFLSWTGLLYRSERWPGKNSRGAISRMLYPEEQIRTKGADAHPMHELTASIRTTGPHYQDNGSVFNADKTTSNFHTYKEIDAPAESSKDTKGIPYSSKTNTSSSQFEPSLESRRQLLKKQAIELDNPRRQTIAGERLTQAQLADSPRHAGEAGRDTTIRRGY